MSGRARRSLWTFGACPRYRVARMLIGSAFIVANSIMVCIINYRRGLYVCVGTNNKDVFLLRRESQTAGRLVNEYGIGCCINPSRRRIARVHLGLVGEVGFILHSVILCGLLQPRLQAT